MITHDFEQELLNERRARLAAERMLELKKTELQAANRQLSDHALALSGEIISQRQVVDDLQGENSRVNESLEQANTKVVAMERLLWAALETIPDGFAMFGPDFRLIAANQPYLAAFDGLSGIEPGVSYQTILDTLLDNGLVDLQGQEEDDWYDMMLDRWVEPTIEPVTLRFWNGIYAKLVDRRTADGGVVSLAINLTKEIRREQELMEARDKAEAADRAKSAFLAKMSHELRTPMNGVVGMAELLAERGLDEEAKLYTETIKHSGNALLCIINDILDFSKMEAERLELESRPFDLEQLIQDVTLIVTTSLRDKPVELIVDYDQFLPTSFVGDAGRLRQVLINLLGNAAKFTEEGSVMLRVVGIVDNSGASCDLHINVEDTGIGIPPEMEQHIFGEFNQLEDEANRRFEGTGLGLTITRKLVELMGGEIWLESQEDVGSNFGFRITLPCTENVERSGGFLPEGLSHVVVWANESLDRSLLDRQLRLLGVEPWCVGSSVDFALGLERRNPNMVICPESRRENCQQLMASYAPTAALLTFAERPGQATDLPKPFTRAQLYEAMTRIYGLRDAKEELSEDPIRVLAAEDNKTNQFVLQKMLQGANIDLKIVDNGQEAVDAFKTDRPDIIMMDISMPIMDGMEASAEIRKLEAGNGRVPIVAMTAHAMAGDEDRILSAGIDKYLTKPLKKTDLLHAIGVAADPMRDAS